MFAYTESAIDFILTYRLLALPVSCGYQTQ